MSLMEGKVFDQIYIRDADVSIHIIHVFAATDKLFF